MTVFTLRRGVARGCVVTRYTTHTQLAVGRRQCGNEKNLFESSPASLGPAPNADATLPHSPASLGADFLQRPFCSSHSRAAAVDDLCRGERARGCDKSPTSRPPPPPPFPHPPPTGLAILAFQAENSVSISLNPMLPASPSQRAQHGRPTSTNVLFVVQMYTTHRYADRATASCGVALHLMSTCRKTANQSVRSSHLFGLGASCSTNMPKLALERVVSTCLEETSEP